MPLRRYLDLNYGQLHYRVAGSGGMPLVCLHMSPYSGAMYEPLMGEMASDHMVIAPDTPGYGMSDRLPGKPTISDYAQAIILLLEGLEISQADLLGFHTGTFIAAKSSNLGASEKRIFRAAEPETARTAVSG